LPFDAVEMRLFATAILGRRSKDTLSVAWQVVLLTDVKEPWLGSLAGVQALLEDAEFVTRNFDQGLRRLQHVREIWPEWVAEHASARETMCRHFRRLHGTDDRATKQDAIEMVKKEAEKRRRENLESILALAREILDVRHPKILEFYNRTTLAASPSGVRRQRLTSTRIQRGAHSTSHATMPSTASKSSWVTFRRAPTTSRWSLRATRQT
jgi:hypothetical protein